MGNKSNRFNVRWGIIIGLALLLVLSLIQQTSGGVAKYRTQVTVSGTIQYRLPDSGSAAEPSDPTNVTPASEPSASEPSEPGTGEAEVAEPDTTEPEADEASAQP